MQKYFMENGRLTYGRWEKKAAGICIIDSSSSTDLHRPIYFH